MKGNVGSTAGYEFVAHDPIADMWAFDRLPKTCRRMIANAPFQISARHAHAHWRTHDAAALRGEIRDSIDLYLAACAKETEVPACPWEPSPISNGSSETRAGSRASANRMTARQQRNFVRLGLMPKTVVG